MAPPRFSLVRGTAAACPTSLLGYRRPTGFPPCRGVGRAGATLCPARRARGAVDGALRRPCPEEEAAPVNAKALVALMVGIAVATAACRTAPVYNATNVPLTTGAAKKPVPLDEVTQRIVAA